MSETERDRGKVGQGEKEAARQPRLSASVNVLTAHLNISLCHELFVSANMCLFACVCVLKVLQERKRKKKKRLLLLGNPVCSCPQGHFLLFAHLPGNPPVTPAPSCLDLAR